MKSDGIVAPWKMKTNDKNINGDIKAVTKKKNHNGSHKRKKVANSKSIAHPTQNNNSKANKNKMKINNTNRTDISSQPASNTAGRIQNKLSSRNDTSRPNQMTTGADDFHKIYQTPSFLSPHNGNSEITEKIPSITTYSNTSTLKQNNNNTSMLDKHTIIFESDTESLDDQVKDNTKLKSMSQTDQNRIKDNSGKFYKIISFPNIIYR